MQPCCSWLPAWWSWRVKICNPKGLFRRNQPCQGGFFSLYSQTEVVINKSYPEWLKRSTDRPWRHFFCESNDRKVSICRVHVMLSYFVSFACLRLFSVTHGSYGGLLVELSNHMRQIGIDWHFELNYCDVTETITKGNRFIFRGRK